MRAQTKAHGQQARPVAGWLVFVLLLLGSMACNVVGFGDATNQRYNAVRRAALQREIIARGPVDEVLVDFGMLEWRDNLGIASGRTVWLNPVARDEFFAQRNAQRTYIYLRTPVDEGDTVLIEVERGGPDTAQARRFTLRVADGSWEVIDDAVLW